MSPDTFASDFGEIFRGRSVDDGLLGSSFDDDGRSTVADLSLDKLMACEFGIESGLEDAGDPIGGLRESFSSSSPGLSSSPPPFSSRSIIHE